MNCGNPDSTQRDVHQHGNTGVTDVAGMGELVWYCNDHMMTSMQTTGYAHVDFTPNQSFTNISRICWDQSLNDVGGRKWIQVSVIPEALYQANGGRMEYVLHELQNDVAFRGLQLTGDALMFASFRGSSRVLVGQDEPHTDFSGFELSSKAPRPRTCLVETPQGGLAVEFYGRSYTADACSMGGCDRRTSGLGDVQFPDGQARVIFQDVTYDGPKDASGFDPLSDATWHWDNILIEVA